MKSWFWATVLFLLGYLIATAVGFTLYYVNETTMWIATLTIMPAIFAYLVYWYLRHVQCLQADSLSQTGYLVGYWIILSFLLDACVYILVVPAAFGAPANWRFFVDQSPWIWLNYLVLIGAGMAGRWTYRWHSRRNSRAGE